jgi:hypothetical protein
MPTPQAHKYAVNVLRSPIIFIGMHRSGTSMLADLLKQLGMFLGYGIQHNESIFFNHLNLYIEDVCNCGWDNPESLVYLDGCSPIRSIVLDYLHKRLTGPDVTLYFRPLRLNRLFPKIMWKRRSFKELNSSWGWKDPRNTFTAGLWKELFPNAKYVHIYRNGVDVAASLRQRETDLLKQRPIDAPYVSPRCCSLKAAFDLWASYIEKAFGITEEVGEANTLHVSYEELLKSPIQKMQDIISFCDINTDHDSLDKVLNSLDPRRSYKFVGNIELENLYLQVKNHPWMEKLGYNKIK